MVGKLMNKFNTSERLQMRMERSLITSTHTYIVFGSVVAVTFQITFRAEIHVNDFFYFLKIIFDISTSKRSKKYKPHSILKKNLKFNETQLQTQCQTLPYRPK
jgi:hypothetical protein